MNYYNHFITLVTLASICILNISIVYADSEHASPLKISIGKDPVNNGDVLLCKYSVVDVNKKIKRATHIIYNDNIAEEYTSDYNCYNNTIHIFTVTIKEDNNTLKQKDLNVNEKVIKNTINGKLLDAVCRINNSVKPSRRK